MKRTLAFAGAAVAAALIVAGIPQGAARAADLGVEGRVFPLAETDLMEFLRAKLEAAKASGRIDGLDKAFAARVRRSLDRPTPVPGLSTTTAARSWLFDPSIVVPKDIADAHGRVFAHAGDVVNPLLRMPDFDRVYLFIDGDDRRQVELGLETAHRYGPIRTKVILVKGSPIELMRREKTLLYFDQAGVMSRRFGLSHVPSFVLREGDKLRISELLP